MPCSARSATPAGDSRSIPTASILAGHGIGGDAAWDIAIAHPDVWAGVIPIVAVADKFVGRYAKNAPYVPWYIVAGELDGDKMSRNARPARPLFAARTPISRSSNTWAAATNRSATKFNACSIGWAAASESCPRKSIASRCGPGTISSGGSKPKACRRSRWSSPGNWPPPRTARPAQIEGKRLEINKVTVKLQASKITVWLSPELVDFKEQLVVEVNNRADLAARPHRAPRSRRSFWKTSAPAPTANTPSGQSSRRSEAVESG